MCYNVTRHETKTLFLPDKPTSDSSVVPLLRYITFRNLFISDETIVRLLVVVNGVPVISFIVDNVTLTGEGR